MEEKKNYSTKKVKHPKKKREPSGVEHFFDILKSMTQIKVQLHITFSFSIATVLQERKF